MPILLKWTNPPRREGLVLVSTVATKSLTCLPSSLVHQWNFTLLKSYDKHYVIFDPQGVALEEDGEFGRFWDLPTADDDESGQASFFPVRTLSDQLAPFDLFGCLDQVLKNGRYEGTLFRFPLRTTESKISDMLYTLNSARYSLLLRIIYNIRDLIDDLKLHLRHMLIFLKSVESVEYYEQINGEELVPKFSIKAKISKEDEPHRTSWADYLEKSIDDIEERVPHPIWHYEIQFTTNDFADQIEKVGG